VSRIALLANNTDFIHKHADQLKEYRLTDKQDNISEKRFKVNADLKKNLIVSRKDIIILVT